jgi:hypothetical protein
MFYGQPVSSMPAGKDECLHGKKERLKPQYDRMHSPDRIDDMQEQPSGRA